MAINLAGTNQALDSSLATTFSAFNLLRDATGVMRGSSRHWTLKPHEGASKRINTYGRLTAFAVADGVDIVQAQSLSDSTVLYTPGEVAVQITLAGSLMRRIQDPDILRRSGQMAANAYDLKEDQDGLAQLVSFTPIVGSAGTVMRPGHLIAALARIGVGNSATIPEPAPPPWYFVHNPLALMIAAANLVPLATTAAGATPYGVAGGAHLGTSVAVTRGEMGENILHKGIGGIGMLWGAMIKSDPNLTADASDDASGGAFSEEGVYYVSELEPRMDPDTSDKSLRGAVELNFWGSYIWGLNRPAAYGCEALFEVILPSS